MASANKFCVAEERLLSKSADRFNSFTVDHFDQSLLEKMADMSSEPTAGRCQLNAESSASVTDSNQLLSFYEKWSVNYDEDFRSEHYVGPRLVAEAVCGFIPLERRGQVKVLDAAAGTGLVGLELSKHGFIHIHAVDASEAMLSTLSRKGVYTHTVQAMFGEKPVGVPDDQYDVVTLSGGFVPGHVPMSALNELIRMCKPGGIITIVMRYEYLQICPEYQPMEKFMSDLEQTNRWKQLCRKITENYLLDKQGIVFVFEKL